jgi:hypothetical protein
VPRRAASAADFGLGDHDALARRSALGTLSLTSRPLLTGYRPREAVTIARMPAFTASGRLSREAATGATSGGISAAVSGLSPAR